MCLRASFLYFCDVLVECVWWRVFDVLNVIMCGHGRCTCVHGVYTVRVLVCATATHRSIACISQRKVKTSVSAFGSGFDRRCQLVARSDLRNEPWSCAARVSAFSKRCSVCRLACRNHLIRCPNTC
jgi:hypothetical protein